MQTIFIENSEMFTKVCQYPLFDIILDKSTAKYYAVSGHLAVEIESKHLDLTASEIKFRDLAYASQFEEDFDREYNPFFLNNYKLFTEEFRYKIDNIHYQQAKDAKFHLFFKKTAKHEVAENEDDYYAVDKEFPWIGFNITKEFGLKIISWHSRHIQDISLKNPKDEQEEKSIRKFYKAWENAKKKSNCPEYLQKIAQQTLNNFFAEREKARRNSDILYNIKNSEEFKNLQSYANNLENSRNDSKKEAGKKFNEFLAQLNTNNINTWVNDLNRFENKFSASFSAYPETCCCCFNFFPVVNTRTDYQDFQILKNKVSQILIKYDYSLQAAPSQVGMDEGVGAELSSPVTDEKRPLLQH